MIRRTSWRIAGALAFAAVLGTTAAVRAQNATTGTLGGVVRDVQLGVLPGASVVALHAPTGTRYEAFTRADGRFDLLNAQVGPYDLEIIRGNPNDKIFVRSDLNLSAAHRLSVRHNHVGATADIGSQSNFRYRFADNFYRFRSRTDSTVAQLNSTFGGAFNLARVSYQRIRDRRGPRTAPFPQVTIDLEGGRRFGSAPSSSRPRTPSIRPSSRSTTT